MPQTIKHPISITILVKNAERTLHKTLSSLADFSEVVILDTGSTDASIEIANQFPNVIVHHAPFKGFGPSHNYLSSLAQHDWILSIDSDEMISPSLLGEIKDLRLDPTYAYSIWRKNMYRGKWIKGCGWYPDRVVRLYNRTVTKFSNVAVHEAVIVDNLKVISLKEPLVHFPYPSVDDFLAKMRLYANLFVQQNQGKKKSSFPIALSHGVYAFIKSYLLQRGFLLGSHGFEISFYNATTAFYKYLLLWEKNQFTNFESH